MLEYSEFVSHLLVCIHVIFYTLAILPFFENGIEVVKASVKLPCIKVN